MSGRERLTIYSALATVCAATSLSAVFDGPSWWGPVVGAVVLVALACGLVRRSPLPSAFEAPAAAVLVLCWLTLLYARAQAPLGFVPSLAALRRLGNQAHTGFNDIQHLPTPVPTHHGLVLLATIGVAGVALLVDLLVVVVRRATLAGLPLLGLYTVCAVTSRHGVGILGFVIVAAGYLTLLFVDNREKVQRWGAVATSSERPPSIAVWAADPAMAPAPASIGRRIGAMAIGLGVVIPLVIPGLHGGVHHSHSGEGSGSSKVVIDPIVAVANDLQQRAARPIFTYHTNGTPSYLRLTSLDDYTSKRSAFSAATLQAAPSAEVHGTLPGTVAPSQPTTTQITVFPDLDLHWLPLPLGTSALTPPSGDWRYDAPTQTVFSASDSTESARYTTTSDDPTPTRQELNSAAPVGGPVTADLAVSHVSTAVKSLTQQVVGNATSAYQKALKIQDFLTGPTFTYDTHIPVDNSADALTHFLTVTRKGFCQQFATAMAVMARLSGIPSRVAVGFTPGLEQPDRSWVVTTHDAHAWPELYFPGAGWVPFEPTPRTDGQVTTPSYAKPRSGHGGHSGSDTLPRASAKPGGPNSQSSSKPRSTGGATASGGSGGDTNSGLNLAVGLTASLVVALLLALITPATVRSVRRLRRRRALTGAHDASAAWEELHDSVLDAGLPWDDGRSPRQLTARLAVALGGVPGCTAALAELSAAEERTRYAARPVAGHEGLWRDVDIVRSALRVRQSAGGRLRSRLMPRSVVIRAKAMRSPAEALLERLDRLRAGGRARLRGQRGANPMA